MFLTGCFQMVAFVPSIMTGVATGNTVQASLSYGFNYGVKKVTGKTPMEHAVSYTIQNDKDVIEALNKDLVSALYPIKEALD